MEWLSSFLLGSNKSAAHQPPCVGILNQQEFILSDTLDHIQCFLEWRASVNSNPDRTQNEDLVEFDDIDIPNVPAKENVLLVLINSPQIDETQLQNIHKSLNVSALYCPKNRFPCLPYSEFQRLILSINEWKNTRTNNGLIVYASQKAPSKQLLLHLGVNICAAPNQFEKMLKNLDELQRIMDKSLARTHSFVVQPLHPSPKISSKALFSSQINFLKHWAAWRLEPPSSMTILKIRICGISLSVTGHQRDLLNTFSDEHPTLELWLRTGFALSSRPALTLKNIEANESSTTQDLVSCGANVQTLELINSVVRRTENSSYHWETELETTCSEGDLLIRIFNSKAMFRIQLHTLFFKSQSSTSTELLLQNSEIDGYDLFNPNCQEGDQLRIKLSLEISR